MLRLRARFATAACGTTQLAAAVARDTGFLVVANEGAERKIEVALILSGMLQGLGDEQCCGSLLRKA